MAPNEFLLAGLLLIAVAVLIVVLLRGRARRPAPPPVPADPFRSTDEDVLRGDPRTLKTGDTVEIRAAAYTVRGSLHLTEGSWAWAEHLLDDASGSKVWLSVEEDPDLRLVLWRAVPSATVLPSGPTVDFDGRLYTRDDAGTARFTTTGSTGLASSGTVRYRDYRAPDGALLSFESYGEPTGGHEKWEVGRGEPVPRADVRVWAQGG